jgi:hypothetical protein
MTTQSKILWLRVSYWSGAIADGIIAIRTMIPEIMGETEFRYAMGIATTLIIGWTCLLIWADRKPVERKGVLLLTIFPVIGGLLMTATYAVATDIFPYERMVPLWIAGVGLIVLMSFSYFNARDL